MTEAQTTLLQALQDAMKALRAVDDAMGDLPLPIAHAAHLEAAMASVDLMLDDLDDLASREGAYAHSGGTAGICHTS